RALGGAVGQLHLARTRSLAPVPPCARALARSRAPPARALARFRELDEWLQQRQSVVAADEMETLRSARVAPVAPVFDLRWFNPRSYMRVLVHLGG
ncbi:unnamed protein product, partial [Closterium sp. NIES-64]